MKWILVAVFINPFGGGITVERFPMQSEEQCAAMMERIGTVIGKATPNAAPIFQGATCLEVEK